MVRALAFDVFGTLLDWRSTIANAFRDSGLEADPDELADDWRARALAATQDVNQKQRPWRTFDELHEITLGELLDERELELPSEGRAALVRAWHQLEPWPHVPAGLEALRRGLSGMVTCDSTACSRRSWPGFISPTRRCT